MNVKHEQHVKDAAYGDQKLKTEKRQMYVTDTSQVPLTADQIFANSQDRDIFSASYPVCLSSLSSGFGSESEAGHCPTPTPESRVSPSMPQMRPAHYVGIRMVKRVPKQRLISTYRFIYRL